jgi:hypothetical protein
MEFPSASFMPITVSSDRAPQPSRVIGLLNDLEGSRTGIRKEQTVKNPLPTTHMARSSPKAKKTITQKPVSQAHHAEFTVFFDVHQRREKTNWETRVYHAETDEEQVFDSTNTGWLQWMQERANLPEALCVPARENTEAAPLEILEAQLLQPFWGELRAELELHCAGKWHSAQFRSEMYGVRVLDQKVLLLGSAWANFEHGSARVSVPLALPESGDYELHVQASLLPPADLVAFHHGPRFTVAANAPRRTLA